MCRNWYGGRPRWLVRRTGSRVHEERSEVNASIDPADGSGELAMTPMVNDLRINRLLHPKCFRGVSCAAALLLLDWGILACQTAPADPGAQWVRAVRLDGTVALGEWMGTSKEGDLQLQASEGVTSIPIDDLESVGFEVDEESAKGQVLFYLADGGRLRGDIVKGATEAVIGKTALGDATVFPWDRLAGIQFAGADAHDRADRLFQEALLDRAPSRDVLISRDAVEVKQLSGILESLEADGGSFVFAGESRKFQLDRIYGIVFAAGAKAQPVFPMTVELADGSEFSGMLQGAAVDAMDVKTSVGATVLVPVAEVVTLRFRGDRLVYLSELKPAKERMEGLVHAPWPMQRDKSVSGSALSIDGRRFERGLGVHSRTELTYAIDGQFERFVSTIGIDDAVRPLGAVVMRVEADSSVLFDSGPLTGTDPPRDVILDVGGVQTLTLIVDYGEGLDVSDQADWADARLIRPRGDKTRAAKRTP